jgi:hypothetical protein
MTPPQESHHGQGTATQQQGEEETEAAEEAGHARDAGTTPDQVVVAQAHTVYA